MASCLASLIGRLVETITGCTDPPGAVNRDAPRGALARLQSAPKTFPTLTSQDEIPSV
jgi:hypothetical protein